MTKTIRAIIKQCLINSKKDIVTFIDDKELFELPHNVVYRDVDEFSKIDYIMSPYGFEQDELRKISLTHHAPLINVFLEDIDEKISKRQIDFMNKTCGMFNIVQRDKDKKYFINQENTFCLEESSLKNIVEKIITLNKKYEPFNKL